MATTDSSSVISESRRTDIQLRDGGVCVLCEDDPIDVAHIVKKTGDISQVPFIRSISPSLGGIRNDDASNLICLCRSHHRQYNYEYYVLVPSEQLRDVLLDHEHMDFSHRESCIASGQPDPGRTFPHIPNEVEYIPTLARQIRTYVHNPTRYDETMFIFDTTDYCPCPLLHFPASPFCLMVQAQAHLARATRLVSERADNADMQITTLLKLYQRQPRGTGDTPTHIPASYASIASTVASSIHPGAHVLATFSSSPPPSHPPTSVLSTSYGIGPRPELPQLTSSSSEDGDANPDLYAKTDLQLLEYARERAVTWEDLKYRQPLFPGEEGGTWQLLMPHLVAVEYHGHSHMELSS